MASSEDNGYNYNYGLGQLNPAMWSSRQPVCTRSQLTDNPLSAYSNSINRVTSPNLYGKMKTFKAIILTGGHTDAEKSPLWSILRGALGSLGRASRMPIFYCMVPELHSYLVNPFLCLDSDVRQRAISRFPVFTISSFENNSSSQRMNFGTFTPGSVVEIEFQDSRHTRGFIKKLVKSNNDPNPPEALSSAMAAFEAAGMSAAFGRVASSAMTPADAGTVGELGTPTSAQPIEGAQAMVEDMRCAKYPAGHALEGQPIFAGVSSTMLAALAANAQHESGFHNDAAGDPRKGEKGWSIATTDGSDGSTGNYCSHGFWQMNVCGVGFGGHQFAEYYGISITDESGLLSAITDPSKQYEFMANYLKTSRDFKQISSQDLYDGYTMEETAQLMAQKIAEKFEKCRSCAAGESSYIERGQTAAAIVYEGGGSWDSACGDMAATGLPNMPDYDSAPYTTEEDFE